MAPLFIIGGLAGNDVRDQLVDLANPKSADHVHHVLPEINDWEKTPEAIDVKRVIMNITSSAEVNQCQKCTCETVINSTGMCTSSEDPSLANSVELPHSALESQLQNDVLHSVDADFDEAPNHVTTRSPQKEKTHTAEAESLEDPRSIATPLRNIDLFHPVKPNILKVLDSVAATNPENDSIDTAKNDSLQVPYSMVICDNESSRNLEQQSSGCHVLPAAINESILQACRLADKISESPDVCAWSNIDISAPDLLLEKKRTLTNSIGGQHFLASPLLEKATLHCVQTDFLGAPYSMSSVMLDMYAGHTSETSSLERIHFPVSPLQENDLLHTVGHAEEVRKRISLSDRSINICPKILEQKNSGSQMVNSAQREGSIKCQPKQSNHAHSKFSVNDKSVTRNVSNVASSKRAGVLHSAESKIATNESLQIVSDRQNNSPARSYEELSTIGSEKFSLLEAHVQRTVSHLDKSSASGIQVNRNSSCENVAMNEQSVEELYGSSSTMSTSSSLDNQDDIHDQMKTTGNLSEKALPSRSYLSRLGSRECFSPNSEGNRNSSNQTSPLTQEVQAAVNYSPERNMSNFSDAICCNFPSMHTSLCSGSNLDANVTTFPQHLLSYSLAKNLDTEFVSLAGFSDFQADGERHGMRQENLSVECPIGGVKTAGADGHSNFDETMQKCQSFNIPIPSNSLTINDMAFQGFCESKKLISLSSSLSAKYKMKRLDGESLLSKFEKLMNRSLSCSIKTSLLDTSYDSKKLGDLGKCSLDFDGAFMTPTCGSSNAYGVQEDSDIPLSLSAEKYDLEKLSGRTGSSSDYLGFMPELPCFRIDEESTNLEENDNQVKLSGCITRNYSRQGLVAKKPPGHATNKYQRNGTNNLDLTAGKSYRRKPDWHAHIRVNQGIKIPKENRALSIRKVAQVTHPLLDRLSKKEMSSSKSERSRGTTNLEKGCRPRNLVSSMPSFIPLVKQKQQYLTSCVKRDVRVRALEAAEAVKRREEKKKAEHEKRKATVELERKRLKQENEHKQVEQQKKKDAYIITRKRQRENDRKRGNDRKKKCVVEAPKHQKKLVEIMHSTNAVKDACPKDTDGKGLVENLARGMKRQLLSDEKMDSVHRLIASESNNLLAMCSDWKSEDSGLQFQESLSDDVDKSYEMSPYEDSDEEHYDNLEHEREIRRKHKLIPSWAQKENLNKILLSNRALVPREVFAHKRSFILSDVLTPVIPYWQFHY